MQNKAGNWIFSASDLTGFLACRHLTHLELSAASGEIERPHRKDPLLELLSKRGTEHEQAHLATLEDQGLTVATIQHPASETGALETAAEETLNLMREGVDVIYQATFFDGQWRGHADFLRKVETPSDLGGHSYEVYDAKLARRPKAAAVLQLCDYSKHVARLQGTRPERMHLILGDNSEQPFKVGDYEAYYRKIKELFENEIAADGSVTYPDPVEHCQICRWWARCIGQRRSDDHLSLVAEIRHDQIKKLNAGDVATVETLSVKGPDDRPKGIAAPTFARLQDQAAMQILGRKSRKPEYKVLEPPGPGLGLELLPEPNEADVFFDIEGDPWAAEEGLQFLFGLSEIIDGEASYRCWWAHDPTEEKKMVEQFVDFITERFERSPAMHVYHYSAAEPSSLKRLVCRYATREEELDQLLRAGVFIDLYRAVRQGLRISEESYSIKQLEPYYGFARDDSITGKSSAIVEYERYLEHGDEAILEEIRVYNQADCDTMLHLRNWLEDRRAEAENLFGTPLSRPEPGEPEGSEELSEALQHIADLVNSLTADISEDPIERTEEQQALLLLAQLLSWHRREAKSAWWAYFDRPKHTAQELVEDTEALGDLHYLGVEAEEKRSLIHRYGFPPQEHKITPGKPCIDLDEKGVNVVGVDDVERVVLVKRGKKSEAKPTAILPGGPPETTVQRQALEGLAESVIKYGIEGPGAFAAIRALLLRRPPRVSGVTTGSDLRHEGESSLGAGCRLALALNDSYLPVQGPPGTGKTYTGAHMIVELVRSGHRVGITATSHKVISNLLEETCKAAETQAVKLSALQRCDEDEACGSPAVEIAKNNAQFNEKWASGEFQVAAGTSWLFSRSDLQDQLHTLFIDEAGQFSLADAAAVAGSCRNLVLLGDPQQLAQPSQGVHPPGSGASVLEHVLGDHDTIEPHAGLFLEKTWRMHPEICDFVSSAFYEGRLESEPHCSGQVVLGDGQLSGSGLRSLWIDHTGNRVASREEAEEIAAAVTKLIGRKWVNKYGKTVTLGPEDILVVAPYNRQVALLKTLLPDDVPVGTVDKFQGQEGAVTFYSMVTSESEDIPRNFEFLYSHNRLNVAVSRARAIAVLVASPALLMAACKTPQQMRLVNALCLFAEYAQDEGG